LSPDEGVTADAFRNLPNVLGIAEYDTLDGTRFLMLKNEAKAPVASGAAQIVVVQNWIEELKRLVPIR
jgi:hypothetical protein